MREAFSAKRIKSICIIISIPYQVSITIGRNRSSAEAEPFPPGFVSLKYLNNRLKLIWCNFEAQSSAENDQLIGPVFAGGRFGLTAHGRINNQ